ncbi:MAG: lipase family protein [Vicinamibacterales bacterium]
MPATLMAIGLCLVALAWVTRMPAMAAAGIVWLVIGWIVTRTATHPRWRTLVRGVGVVTTLVGLLLVAALGVLVLNAHAPVPDAFYATEETSGRSPGDLLRAEPFERAVPPGGRAWRILYTTTRADGVPAVASAVVLAPRGPADGPRPVVAWTHGTTGVVAGCAPTTLPAPFPFDATVPAIDRLLAEQWVLVGTDYAGLGTEGGHPYLIGEAEARSALDAVRAARRMTDVSLDARTVVWGHSQGGHAALWAGIVATRYAPDVPISGVAALAPATALPALVDAAQHTIVGRIMASFVMTAYGAAYDDVRVDDYVGPRARARAMASRCLSGAGALLSVVTAATMETPFFERSPREGALGLRLEQNVPRSPIAAPVLVAQGLADDLVLPAVQGAFVRERCEAGQRLEYRTYAGRDHVSLVAAESALSEDLVAWTRERFRGVPAPDGCPIVTR